MMGVGTKAKTAELSSAGAAAAVFDELSSRIGVVELVSRTRGDEGVRIGVSPRASIALMRVAHLAI